MSPELLAAMIGLFMPPIISLVKRPGWPVWAKLGVAGAVSLIAGAASAWVSGQFDWTTGPLQVDSVLQSAAACFTAATAIYRLWFAGLPLNEKLTKI